ncbi:uncharacterized protein Z518_01596 [Rhinocladiella mackenziei CBS 650.93]|uniref:Bacteriophage T5 Orf172 DNA-binding domain-containing protein n=1 Tax=Rhinocladiella mackenziei CBS 650.93 TaxID=1442369 RepID=A0A0D2HIR3_9EURO|nr:uncharacterized protein Z518_01596 [Rhinocladiella mackenziei CBS 650.93]KIX10513.1 hypothetical protein Z518_01596 [Rhinocladiella mackenziei CBS 650.93]
MSFHGCTPESLLPRSDSKNPATTCNGITSTGRPCRRARATSPTTSPATSPSRDTGTGIIAVLDQQNAAAFYCWQHRDQAEQLATKDRQTKTSLHPLKRISSIDTLVERVGILELDENVPSQQWKRYRRRHGHGDGPTRPDTLPTDWNGMQGPLMTVPKEMVRPQQPRPKIERRSPSPRSNVKLSWACCIQVDHDDLPPPRVRHSRSRPSSSRQSRSPAVHDVQTSSVVRPDMSMGQSQEQLDTRSQSHSRSATPPVTTPRPRPTPASSNSQTRTLLSLIPSHLSPQTTSLLLTELSRPISSADATGYIYIFWLTPESRVSKPDDEAASSLLDDDDDDDLGSSQKTNETLTRYASIRCPNPRSQAQAHAQRTITLKIGRTANVHRRMTQWAKQCEQNITLIRYYPYPQHTNNATGSHLVPGRKVPHVHRVERLIHLELAEKRVVNAECSQCGREHREWFEIEASRVGLRAVDEVVRRWVGWAERQ